MTLKPAIEAREPGPTTRSRLPRWLLIVINLVLFVGAFYGARTFVAAQWPWQPGGSMADKLAAYEESAADYNTIAVGSSRVFRQVDPTTFDARMAELGYGTGTFNLGVAGMTAIETRDYLRRIMAVAPDGLEFVIIAPETLEARLRDGNVDAIRTVAWHDTTNTRIALRTVWSSDDALSDKADYAYNHLAAYVTNLSGTGQFLAEVALRPDPASVQSVGLRGDGWLSLDDFEAVGSNAVKRNLANRQRRLEQAIGPDGFPRVVERLTTAAAGADGQLPSLGELEADYLADLVSIVRAAGAEPIFLVPPGGDDYSSGWLRRAATDGVIPVLLDFGDPRLYPDLFTYDAWFDQNHLDKEASIRFSGYLADEIAAYLAAAMPGLDLPPAPTVDVILDSALLAGESIALDLDGTTLVKVETRAFLALTGVEGMGASAVEIVFGADTEQPGGLLQVRSDGRWEKAGDAVTAGAAGVIVFDLDGIPPGAALRVKITGGVGTRVEAVRVLGILP